MLATMPRIRVVVDVSEAHKRAFLARASFEGVSTQELFERWVESQAAEEFERAREMMGTEADGDGDGDEPVKPPRKGKAK